MARGRYRRYKRRRVYRRRKSRSGRGKRRRTWRKRAAFSRRKEIKFIRFDISSGVVPASGAVSPAIAGGAGSGAGISVGAGLTQRIGRQVRLVHCQSTVTISLPEVTQVGGYTGTYADDELVLKLMVDTQCNSTQWGGWTGIVINQAPLIDQQRDTDYTKRLKCARSWRFKLHRDGMPQKNTASGTTTTVDTYWPRVEKTFKISWTGSILIDYNSVAEDGEIDTLKTNNVFWASCTRQGLIILQQMNRWSYVDI